MMKGFVDKTKLGSLVNEENSDKEKLNKHISPNTKLMNRLASDFSQIISKEYSFCSRQDVFFR